MSGFIIRPIGRTTTSEVRTTLRAPQYGHQVQREVARGTGPCRECLSTFAVGHDDRLLFTYNPFSGSDDVAQPGPVFIHADACEPFGGDGYPEGLRSLPMLAEAYLSDGSRAALQTLVPGEEAQTLSALLRDSRVRFVHLRHAQAGCFIARVDRAVTEQPTD
jgi:hypothetical protein